MGQTFFFLIIKYKFITKQLQSLITHWASMATSAWSDSLKESPFYHPSVEDKRLTRENKKRSEGRREKWDRLFLIFLAQTKHNNLYRNENLTNKVKLGHCHKNKLFDVLWLVSIYNARTLNNTILLRFCTSFTWLCWFGFRHEPIFVTVPWA